MWRSPPGRCSCGPALPDRSIRPSCNGCSACASVSSGRPDRNNTREIAGFTPEALRTFSKRTVEIEAELEATGASYEAPALRMRADDEASLATRPAKDHTATPAAAVRSVADRGRRDRPRRSAPGWSVGCVGVTPTCGPSGSTRSPDRLVDDEHGLCAHSARFAEHDVIEHIAALAAGRLSTVEITEIAEQVLGVGSGRPAHSQRRDVGVGTGALVDRRPTRLEDDTLRLLDRLTARAGAPDPATDRRRTARVLPGSWVPINVRRCRRCAGRADRCARCSPRPATARRRWPTPPPAAPPPTAGR